MWLNSKLNFIMDPTKPLIVNVPVVTQLIKLLIGNYIPPLTNDCSSRLEKVVGILSFQSHYTAIDRASGELKLAAAIEKMKLP